MPPRSLIELLLLNNYSFITGVPDSIFKHFLTALNKSSQFQHIITNNEGEACALAAGYHLATGKTAVVYMQNSGLGNSINPLTSLLDAYIYSIPALLFIAWRGLPGQKDEPQHARMGEILPGMLALLDIKYSIASDDLETMQTIFQQAKYYFKNNKKPYAILFPKNVIKADINPIEQPVSSKKALIREHLLESIVQQVRQNDIIVTTTGKTSREVYEIRARLNHDHSQDFLTVGSMGCASTIGLGIAMQRPDRRVIVIDGDGACLMRLEALATIGHIQPSNFLHIVIDNQAYESTGSQATLSATVDFIGVAKACGYKHSLEIDNLDDFNVAFSQFTSGPMMLVVNSMPYSRPDLGRPKTTPIENKNALMDCLRISL